MATNVGEPRTGAGKLGGSGPGAPARLAVASPDFGPGQPLPRRFAYRGEGDNVSPALRFGDVPDRTQSFAVICEDPDAPRPRPWVHWVLYDIPADRRGLPSGSIAGGLEGANDYGEKGWGGPFPPRGHGVHHYHFTVFALDTKIGASAGLTRDQLLERMRGHVLGQGEVVGTYERK